MKASVTNAKKQVGVESSSLDFVKNFGTDGKTDSRVWLKENVYEMAKKRINYIFDEFEEITVSFSGGKDSTVLLDLVNQVCEERGKQEPWNILVLDYECEYTETTAYIKRTLDRYHKKPNVTVYHICMPFLAGNGVSMTQDYWRPWDPEKKDIWVRDMPEDAINIDNHPFDFWNDQLDDYQFQMEFGEWLGRTGKGKAIALTGIRAQESRVRYIRAVTENNKYKDQKFILELKNGTYNGFPLYDWLVDDVWTAITLNNWDYNHIYDLYYQSGMSIDSMRVSSPFNSHAINDLQRFKALEPNTWNKLLGRIDGVNTAGLYGGTTLMGWKNITKPDNFTWREYVNFLINTYPADMREYFAKKFNTSIEFWKNKGGVIHPEILKQLDKNGIKYINHGPKNPNSKYDVITFPDYPDTPGDIMGFKDVPSYKRMAVALMKNDVTLKYMGFSPTQELQQKRKLAMQTYQGLNDKVQGKVKQLTGKKSTTSRKTVSKPPKKRSKSVLDNVKVNVLKGDEKVLESVSVPNAVEWLRKNVNEKATGSAINRVLKGNRKSAYGYRYERVED